MNNSSKIIKRILTLFLILACFGCIDATATQETLLATNTPEHLYKIVSIDQWQESLQRHVVAKGEIDTDFIHLAKEDQLEGIVQKFWNGQNHVILKLASNNLVGRLAYEKNPGGNTLYYHLYEGSIPLEAVVDVFVEVSD